MSAKRSWRLALFVGMTPVLATCWIGPSAGELVVDLATAPDGTRAVQFAVTAVESKTIESITPACGGCQVFTARVADGDVRGVVSGSIRGGPLLRVLVSDVDAIEAYSTRVVDAADAAFALLDPADFGVEIRKP